MKRLLIGFLVLVGICIPIISFAQAGLSEMNSWIESKLAADNSSVSGYLFLFLGGLMASLLPCVYPLYPITISFLKNRGTQENQRLHPIIYYAGLTFIYLVFGIVAGITGGAFNQIMRLPLTNLGIGIIIALMGAAVAGWLHIPYFTGGQADTQKAGLPGTFIMGMGAGLMASSCVGPVVVSIILGITAGISGFSVSVISIAAFKMFLFGLGLGIPFLLIGVFGLKLPKSGNWMKYVQWILGVLIIYFGFTYIEKALAIYGFNDQEILLIAIGSLAMIVGVFAYQSKNLSQEARLTKAIWSYVGVVGILILARGILSVEHENAQTMVASAGGEKIEKEAGLTWYLDKSAAYEEARENGKMVFIDFYADWCTNCKAFQADLKENNEFRDVLSDQVLLKIYDTDPEFEDYQNDTRFPELKVGLPFFVITDSQGNLLYKTSDYLKTDEMALFLE